MEQQTHHYKELVRKSFLQAEKAARRKSVGGNEVVFTRAGSKLNKEILSMTNKSSKTEKDDIPHGDCAFILCTKIVQDVYNWCIQNVYHILANLCTHFVYKIKRTMPAKFYIQNVYKSLSKCGMLFVYKHFVYKHFVFKSLSKYRIHFVCKHFVFILYTKVCQNMGYILYTFCIHFIYKIYTKVCQNVGYILYINILYTFCMHQFWST